MCSQSTYYDRKTVCVTDVQCASKVETQSSIRVRPKFAQNVYADELKTFSSSSIDARTSRCKIYKIFLNWNTIG